MKISHQTHKERSDEGKSIRRQSISGVTSIFTGQVAKLFLTTGSTVVMARLLDPIDFGLVGMVAVITAFFEVLRDGGLASAAVQAQAISPSEQSSLFWLNTILGALLFALLWAVSPMIAQFNSQPNLTSIAKWMGLIFPISALSTQHKALLQREMRFEDLARIEVGSTIAGVAVGISVACCGGHWWALVWMALTTEFASTVGMWIFTKWLPEPKLEIRRVKSLINFGGYMVGFNILNYFARNFDRLAIGRVFGPEALGIYTRAYSIFMLPLTMITTPLAAVAIPALSRLRETPEKYAAYYVKIQRVMAIVVAPVCGLSILFADSLILVMFGEKWSSVAHIYRLLALSGFIIPAISSPGWLHVSSGRSHRLFRWGCIASPCLVILVAIGLNWGIEGVATLYGFGFFVMIWPCLAYACRETDISSFVILKGILKPSVCVALSAAVVWSVSSRVEVTVLTSALSVVAFIGIYFVCLCLTKEMRSLLVELGSETIKLCERFYYGFFTTS